MKKYSSWLRRLWSWFRGFWNWLRRRIPGCRPRYGTGAKYEKLDKSESETYDAEDDAEDKTPLSYMSVVSESLKLTAS